MKVKIKSIEEIEKTLDGDYHNVDYLLYFRPEMRKLCGKVVDGKTTGSYKIKTTTDKISWFWHPDWYEVVEPDFTEEDLMLIDFMSETLEYFMEQK